jgi:hypothetical protein
VALGADSYVSPPELRQRSYALTGEADFGYPKYRESVSNQQNFQALLPHAAHKSDGDRRLSCTPSTLSGGDECRPARMASGLTAATAADQGGSLGQVAIQRWERKHSRCSNEVAAEIPPMLIRALPVL